MAAGTLPPEIFAQQQELNRQQKMADLLMQQGMQQPQGQMVSGRFVPTSFFQNIAPLAQMYFGQKMAERGDKQALDLAKQLRQTYADELSQYQNLNNPKNTELAGPTLTGDRLTTVNLPDRQAANLFAATAYNPALQAVGMKNLTQGPKWEKAELPNPDGSIRKGWVDYNAANPLSTFVEGGTKPAFTSLEGAKFQYETGMPLPRGNAPANVPINMPTGGSPLQVNANMPVTPSGSMPPQTPVMGGGRGMSPSAANEANKQIFVDTEKRRLENLEKSPQVIATMTDTLRNIDDLIGDARIVKDAKGKESISYSITKDGKKVEGRKPMAGFETAVGFGLPSYLTPAGSSASDFRVRLDQIKDKTFLQAFESLKGAGQITEKEGEKATSALNRMSTAQSEVEFIKAAREFEENVRTGMDLAKRKVGISTGNAPSNPSARLRWNPAKNAWE